MWGLNVSHRGIKSLLSPGFIGDDADGGGQVEATHARHHGDGGEPVWPLQLEFFRQSGRFRAKDEQVIWRVGDVGIAARGFAGVKIEIGGCRVQQRFQVVAESDVYPFPVV